VSTVPRPDSFTGETLGELGAAPSGRSKGPVDDGASTLRVSASLLISTFAQLRSCGRGRAECQVLWVGPWSAPDTVAEIVHPLHRAHRGGFVVDDVWITSLFINLARREMGIRAQIHTHPTEAFHSATDDTYPAVHMPGLFSLVIPDFAQGAVTLEQSYLAQLGTDGRFHQIDPFSALDITALDATPTGNVRVPRTSV
jgi:hypothetical protein